MPEAAAAAGIEVWALPEMMEQIAVKSREGRTYQSDDILRTIDLFARGIHAKAKRERKGVVQNSANGLVVASANLDGFYVYENWTNKRARLHRAACTYCKGGQGSQASTGDKNGQWHGPFADAEQARAKLSMLDYDDKGECGACM